MNRRVAIVTTKQPGTNPRMRKNADALAAAGYDVNVLYAFNAAWADKADKTLFQNTIWTHYRIGGHPKNAPLRYFIKRVKRKWSQWHHHLDGQFCPSKEEYVKGVAAFQPNLVIGHNPGSLPILTKIQTDLNLKVLFDAEDFHRGEFPKGSKEIELVSQLEDRHIPSLKFMTAASPLIKEAYQKLYPGVNCETIKNTFEVGIQPEFKSLSGNGLKLCWFSQVVGLNRGLQEFLCHLTPLRDLALVITIVGNATDQVKSILSKAIKHPNHKLQFLPATSETNLAKILSENHIGLALEPGFSENNLLAQSNKIFFYPLCGCFTLLSRTPGQLNFLKEHPKTGYAIDLNEPKSSVEILRRLAENPSNLEKKRHAAWVFARTTLNWETESQKLVAMVAEILQDAP